MEFAAAAFLTNAHATGKRSGSCPLSPAVATVVKRLMRE
jgi:hypothetical protein